MCLHVATPSSEQVLQAAPYLPDYEQPELFHVSAFSAPPLAVQISEEPNYIMQGNWGLVPTWVKDRSTFQAMTFNAVSETIFETKSYKGYIGHQRALLWVNGFYEFQHRDNGKLKVPHFIYMPERRPFTMGCVYSWWGEQITFSIITTEANELMSEIHNSKHRMPLIIEPSLRGTWLGELNKAEIQDMMRVYPDDILQAHTVSRDIVKRGYDTNQVGIQAEVLY